MAKTLALSRRAATSTDLRPSTPMFLARLSPRLSGSTKMVRTSSASNGLSRTKKCQPTRRNKMLNGVIFAYCLCNFPTLSRVIFIYSV